MKRALVCLGILLMSSEVAHCQSIIPEAKVAVTLPGSAWPAFTRELRGEQLVYISKRSSIIDKAGQTIIPNIAFILEQIPAALDLKTFSTELQRELTKEQPDGMHNFRVQKTYRAGDKNAIIRQKNMVGYQMSYLDKKSIAHTVYVVYIIHNSIGIQAIFDSTTEVFRAYPESKSHSQRPDL